MTAESPLSIGAKAAVPVVVIPIGPGKEAALDTVDSVSCYCPDAVIVLCDDHTNDGTYEALTNAAGTNWRVLRNERQMGSRRLVHTLCSAYRFVLDTYNATVVLRLVQDALIKPGIIEDALRYTEANPTTGMFGVYVYFSMAAGYELGHFAAPDGRLCLEWRGLPYPAEQMAQLEFKIVHSVDKGHNTESARNGGRPPREIFLSIRSTYRSSKRS